MDNQPQQTIAVITFHSWINGNLNYGATLQAYALCQALRQMGHSVELIDYIPECIDAGSWAKNIYRWIFRFLLSRKVPAGKRAGFNQFIQQNCFLSSVHYPNLKALRDSPPAADVYVVGSDQVWNTRIFHGSLFSAFFLGFGPKEKRRVSYASSFGTHEPDTRYKVEIQKMLNTFSSLSVREKSGIDVIKELLGKEASVESVLDPTLLLEDYDDVAIPQETAGMLLAYLFEPSPRMVELLKETAEKQGLKPALIWDERMPRFEGIECVECNSPAHWLGAMKGASAVLTNSFHGTVFSILFQKPFVSLLAESQGVENRNTRILDLAEKLGLDHNLTPARDALSWAAVLEQPIDWTMVGKLFQKERQASLGFLQRAVSIQPGNKSGSER